jgi:predicted transcriptional regulator
MKNIQRRDKLKIYGDLLSMLNAERGGEKIILTRIQVKANVPFDRLKKYLSDLNDLGLIENEDTPVLTEKGKQYLREFEEVLDFMKRMGVAYR